MFFLGIVSWNGASLFKGGRVVFQMGGSFLTGRGTPWRASVLMGGFLTKFLGWGATPPCPFFSLSGFFHKHSWITRLQGMGEGISLTPHYHFHPLHRHLDISWAITAENSPLHIASSRTCTRNLWFPSASH